MTELIKIIKENRLTKNHDKAIVIEMFSAFKKDPSNSKYKVIGINSSLLEIERIAPFSERKDEFERSIQNAIEKEKYRSDQLQSIEKKYSDLERTAGDVSQFNDWPLDVAVYRVLNETDDLFIQDFISIIAKRHEGSMFYFDDINDDLEIIADAIHDYRMREYLRAYINSRREEIVSELDAEYKIFIPSKIGDFLNVESSLLSNGFIDNEKVWKKQNNELIAFIRVLNINGYFKKQKHLPHVKKGNKEANFIELGITEFFESRYQIDLTNQRKESYIVNNKERINKLSKFIASIVKV